MCSINIDISNNVEKKITKILQNFTFKSFNKVIDTFQQDN